MAPFAPRPPAVQTRPPGSTRAKAGQKPSGAPSTGQTAELSPSCLVERRDSISQLQRVSAVHLGRFHRLCLRLRASSCRLRGNKVKADVCVCGGELDALLGGDGEKAGSNLQMQVGGGGRLRLQTVGGGRFKQAGHLRLLRPRGRCRQRLGTQNPGIQKAPGRGSGGEASRRPCPPVLPLAPSGGRWPRRPHLGTLNGGRAIMRGREVSTTSPRLASTRMFWIMFSSSASCRIAKAGSLRGGRREAGAPGSAPSPTCAGLLHWPPLCCTVCPEL